jgi:hypothetical protein
VVETTWVGKISLVSDGFPRFDPPERSSPPTTADASGIRSAAVHRGMTHDTPGDEGGDRRWCDHCGISVEPVTGDDGPECPSCGGAL